MAVEAIGSITVGLMAGSLAMLAFGGNSVVELISGVVVLHHLRKNPGSPGTSDRRTALVTTALLFAIILIGLGTIYSYLTALRPERTILGIAISAGAIIIMPFLWFEKKDIGRGTSCLPI